jgi:hypothetical protein
MGHPSPLKPKPGLNGPPAPSRFSTNGLQSRRRGEPSAVYFASCGADSGASTILGWNRVPATRVAIASSSLCP